MDEKPYLFKSDNAEYTYRFESVSDEKRIQKLVLLTETDNPTIVNLALLDEMADGELSDTSVSDNDDMRTVLATVFRIAADFLNRNPNYSITFRGSDDRRNRLYRIVISREIDRLISSYEVYGFNGQTFSLFKNNEVYHGFLIRRRL